MKFNCNTISTVFLLKIMLANVNCYMSSSADAGNNNNASILLTLLNTAQGILKEATTYASSSNNCKSDGRLCSKPMDCAEVQEIRRSSKSGIYKIWPRSRLMDCAVDVYCDMEDNGGGWTVLQRRGDFDSAKDYFFKEWEDYKEGFGDLEKDFWLGNDKIFALTSQRNNMVKFSLVDWEGNKTYATYDEFWIDDEYHKYAMHVRGYRGLAGDSFSGTNGALFSTKDKDHDTHKEGSCAVMYKGAWWYTSCHSSNLNGYYLKGPHESYADGVEWNAFRGQKYSLKDTSIKIRPKHFTKDIENITPQ